MNAISGYQYTSVDGLHQKPNGHLQELFLVQMPDDHSLNPCLSFKEQKKDRLYELQTRTNAVQPYHFTVTNSINP